jgi:3-phenylpropionate/cinnamic acid dioxygenase small subunit
MSTTANPPKVSAELRFEIGDLYTAYARTLDEGDYPTWPGYFVEDAVYRIVPRENYVRGLPIAIMHCESKGMIEDRAYAVQQLNMVQPRVLRHIISGIAIDSAEGDRYTASADFLIVQTLFERMTEIVLAGRYIDEIVRQDGRLLFQKRLCVYDSLLVPTSLIAPV